MARKREVEKISEPYFSRVGGGRDVGAGKKNFLGKWDCSRGAAKPSGDRSN